MRRWECGAAIFHEGLPLVYDLNYVRVEQGCGLDAEEIASRADDLMTSLGHRQILVDHDVTGEQLAPGFHDLGWRVDRHVIMVHRAMPDRLADTSEVVQVEEEDVWPSREEYLRGYPWCDTDESASQMHAAYRIWMRAGDGRDFAILRDGKPVSFALRWRRNAIVQIEDVATLEAYRNQGLSRAVVTHALEVAYEEGAELVFLVADAEDWPKEFYAKLGFAELANTHHFLKTNS